MTGVAHTIGILFSNPTDEELLVAFLRECGYGVVTTYPSDEQSEDWERVGLWIIDEAAANVVGSNLVERKQRVKENLLPLLVALDASADATPWLDAGFDDVLRMPLSMAELRARIGVFLRLRDQSLEGRDFERARFRTLIEQIPAGALVAEAPSGRVLFGNEQLARIWRHPVHKSSCIQEYGQWRGFHPDGRPYEPEEWPLARSIRSGERVVDEEIEIERGDGTRGTVLVSSAPILDREGRIVAAVATDFDITEKKALLESEREARRAAEEASRLKDEFLSSISHELRTPLNAILGWVQLAELGTLDAKDAARALATIKRNAKAQLRIVEDLLDISRILAGKFHLEAQPVELSTIVRSAVEAVLPAAQNKELQIQISIDTKVPIFLGDPNRLQQVVWNLLSNAVKFTPAGGTVTVRLERVDSHLELAVTDSGQGISASFLPYVFDRFRQADGSHTRIHGGLGLGLAIVKEIVGLHGGTVDVASEGPDRGSAFTVRLPLSGASAALPEAEWAASDRTPGQSAGPDLGGARVLIVEDDRDSREMLEMLLRRHGAVPTSCETSAEALAQFESGRFAVIICDIGLPDSTGYSLMREIRAREGPGERTPAIALTAYTRLEDRLRALEEGFQMHVPKPVDAPELIAVIASLLER